MRQRHQAPVGEAGAGGRQRRTYFRGVMRKIVHQHDAVEFAYHLKASPHTGKTFQRFPGDLPRHVQLKGYGQCRQRVVHVVGARNAQVQLAEGRAVADDARGGGHPVGRVHFRTQRGIGTEAVQGERALDVTADLCEIVIVTGQHDPAVERNRPQKRAEGTEEMSKRIVTLQMLRLDVGGHRHDRGELQKGLIEFIGLGYQDVTLTDTGTRVRPGETTADDDGGIETGVREDVTDHGRDGTLAVCTAHGDAPAQPHQFGQHLGTQDNGNVASPCLLDLRVVLPDGRRDEHHLGIADGDGIVPRADAGTERDQPIGDVRLGQVGTRHIESE